MKIHGHRGTSVGTRPGRGVKAIGYETVCSRTLYDRAAVTDDPARATCNLCQCRIADGATLVPMESPAWEAVALECPHYYGPAVHRRGFDDGTRVAHVTVKHGGWAPRCVPMRTPEDLALPRSAAQRAADREASHGR